ncbi:MAG: DEAD/DEAH box helicase family protein [Truepera sp.]|nr:DEAD/DEAH box helicase family protein [Truepera sp.]
MISDFQSTLDHIRSSANSKAHQGRLFERLMKAYFLQDPLYQERFANVWLWSEWAGLQQGLSGTDTGIDLVAEEREGGYCAIQCKCYAPGTVISKRQIDSFISASARQPFGSRIIVDTGDSWGPNASKTLAGLQPACSVLRFGDLAGRPINWPDLIAGRPEDLVYRAEPFRLRPHQQEALDNVVAGFKESDRGKLIMACGTGKTFTALRIAEAVAKVGGRVLYLVPSISLFQQSMREWATQQEVPHRYIGICSDTRAGRTDEDASLQELELPVTTDPQKISQALQEERPEALTVVFSTYQSLDLVRQAQDEGAPDFNLILCDEAHRTTGIEQSDVKTSPFVLVHDQERIRAEKRLYLTATPRLYTEGAKAKAVDRKVEIFSMDDPATYGPEFHRLPFSRAVEQDLLSDYKVIIFTIAEEHVDAVLQQHLTSHDSEIDLTDTAKIVGCWNALRERVRRDSTNGSHLPRAIAFTNTIKSSQNLEQHWSRIVDQAIERLPEEEQTQALRCDLRHVDGKHHALDRKARIEWLKQGAAESCRILTNARCLSEGIDVPALDAVLFMSPRNSHVDIVQAVGRTMRKAEGKEYGYIVLPVTIPAGVDPAAALDDNERFATVWSVLRALRSHDDRFDVEINQLDLNKNPNGRIIIDPPPNGKVGPLPPLDLPPGAIYAKIVEKCGDRKYWQSWAEDVAEIFPRLISRIEGLLANPANETLREWFDAFLAELQETINDSITRESATRMMAQHILTGPVFGALFEHYDFAAENPVAKRLEALEQDFGEFGLENETRDLEGFYESVRQRARGLDNSDARQRVLTELYERFFITATKKDADRLGIVYTPIEVVDFILASADQVLRQEFGRSLTDEGVHILDPFTGTGTFLVRLLGKVGPSGSELIRDEDVARKFREELHANEIVLLAYYIAAIHIEEAFHGRRGDASSYEPFSGIALTDTFNLHGKRAGLQKIWLPENSDRVERQQKLPIQVIVGNPPWSAGQRSAADDNPNVDYPELEQRVAETYAVRSKATLKNSLYDSYKMAIRWASDRIGEQGVIAFVTNGSWIDGNADSGIRACLAEEFSSVYVLNLRGNARTSGELRRAEGDNAFGQGSRAPVAITILVRNPAATDRRIRYRDIGDYLDREEKLRILGEAGSIAGLDGWLEVKPDQHHDWIGQRDEAFQEFYPLGSQDAKAGKADDAIFGLYSRGLATSRDAYIYNFSRDACAENARKMVADYLGALKELKASRDPNPDVEAISRRHSTNVRWDQALEDNLRRRKTVVYSADNIWSTQYRPFVKQHCYVDYVLVNRKYQLDRIFPATDSENRAICVPGIGSTRPFSALMVDTMPNLHFVAFGQCFPRYRYVESPGGGVLYDNPGVQRFDNISDTALRTFRTHYRDNAITKDDIFDYVYGVLHAPSYRQRFANNFAKELPRVPFAPDFHAFVEAGRDLAALHLGYESCEEYPLEVRVSGQPGPEESVLGDLFGPSESVPPGGDPVLESKPELFRIGTRAMRFKDDPKSPFLEKSVLIINDHIQLCDIPVEAHRYEVNGRTPLGWFIDRYRVTRDKRSGILNDPNGWFADPRDLITAIRRIVYLSVETVRIAAGLPTDIGMPEYR